MQIPDPQSFHNARVAVAGCRSQAGGPSLSDVVLTKGTSEGRRFRERGSALWQHSCVTRDGDGQKEKGKGRGNKLEIRLESDDEGERRTQRAKA